MPFDAMNLIMTLAPMMLSGLADRGGNEGEFKSTYGPGALSTLDQIQNMVKGGLGGGVSDITQNPNYQQGQQWLSSLFNDPEFFNKFEAPMQRQFQEQTVPELANRFAGMGSGGALGSTAFRNQLGREGSKLQEAIAAMRGGMQQQGVNQALGYAQQPVQNFMQMLQQALTPTQNIYQPPTPGPFGNILSSLTGGMAQGIGNMWGQGMVGNPGGNTNALPTNVSFPSTQGLQRSY